MRTFKVRVLEPEWRRYDYKIVAKDETEALEKALRGDGEVVVSWGTFSGTVCPGHRRIESIDEITCLLKK